jgi:hypothetical protein
MSDNRYIPHAYVCDPSMLYTIGDGSRRQLDKMSLPELEDAMRTASEQERDLITDEMLRRLDN